MGFCTENSCFRKLIHSTMDLAWTRNKPPVYSSWLEARLYRWLHSFSPFKKQEQSQPLTYTETVQVEPMSSPLGVFRQDHTNFVWSLRLFPIIQLRKRNSIMFHRWETCKRQQQQTTEGTHTHSPAVSWNHDIGLNKTVASSRPSESFGLPIREWLVVKGLL